MHDCDIAIAVADAGAAVVRRCFGTHADIEAEHAMCAVLHCERPADAILGEESGRSGACSGVRTWLLDPLWEA